MKNSEKYIFSDFTLENYKYLLELALTNGFVFSDYDLDSSLDVKNIIWRHDVEFSVHRALKMAQIENKLGIRAHYFIQIHSEFYNVLEKEVYDLVLKIRDLRHFIGLHFDAYFWNVHTRNELECFIRKDKRILEELFEIDIHSFSFHNTTPELLSMDELYYSGLLNVYARDIRDKYRYCTDSTGIWRYERLENVLNEKSIKHLQVLTHDGMWQDEVMAPRQRVINCIMGRSHKTIQWYDSCLQRLGQKNIDIE